MMKLIDRACQGVAVLSSVFLKLSGFWQIYCITSVTSFLLAPAVDSEVPCKEICPVDPSAVGSISSKVTDMGDDLTYVLHEPATIGSIKSDGQPTILDKGGTDSISLLTSPCLLGQAIVSLNVEKNITSSLHTQCHGTSLVVSFIGLEATPSPHLSKLCFVAIAMACITDNGSAGSMTDSPSKASISVAHDTVQSLGGSTPCTHKDNSSVVSIVLSMVMVVGSALKPFDDNKLHYPEETVRAPLPLIILFPLHHSYYVLGLEETLFLQVIIVSQSDSISIGLYDAHEEGTKQMDIGTMDVSHFLGLAVHKLLQCRTLHRNFSEIPSQPEHLLEGKPILVAVTYFYLDRTVCILHHQAAPTTSLVIKIPDYITPLVW